MTHRWISRVACLAALLFAASTHARVPDDRRPLPSVAAYFSEQRAALAAYESADAAAFRRHADAALRANPGHPPARYLAAAAAAMAGDSAHALAELRALAELGLVQSPRSEKAFAKLLGDSGFLALERRFAANALPRGKTRLRLAATALPGDFVAESFALDTARARTLIASVRQRRIAAIDARGRASDFVARGEHGLMSALGMHVAGDELLVASAGMAEMRPADALLDGKSAVFAFALDDGSLRSRWDVAGTIGDLLVLDDGRLLVSDSGGGSLWLLERASGRSVRLPGGRADAAADVFGSPQGMASLGGSRVAFADYTTGIWVVDVDAALAGAQDGSAEASGAHGRASATQAYRRLASAHPAALYGIDGLYAHRDSLLAIQNGTRPQRILRLHLDRAKTRIERVEVLAAAQPTWDEPTLGEVVGDDFCFVANSHWPKFGAKGELPAAETLSPPRVECVEL